MAITDNVSIMRGGGCYSSLGKRGGKQDLSLAQGCTYSVGTPIHEFMHAIGIYQFQNSLMEIIMMNNKIVKLAKHITYIVNISSL